VGILMYTDTNMCTMELMGDTNVHISFEILILMCTIVNMDFGGLVVHISIKNRPLIYTMVAYCTQ
jgi:hypothetical protein